MLALLAACQQRPDPADPHGIPATPPAFTSEPRIELAVSPDVALVQRIVAATDVPTDAVVVLDDGERRREITFSERSADHDLPLLALLPETAYTAAVTFTDAAGEAVATTLSFTTGAALEPLAEIDVLVADRARMEPGYTAFPLRIGPEVIVVAVDPWARPVWTWASGRFEAGALEFHEGVFSILLDGVAVRWRPDGEVLGAWYEYGEAEATGDLELPFLIHHEAMFEDDGSFWTFIKQDIPVDAFPTTALDPSVTAPAMILDDHVVHVAPDGQVLADFSLADRLDPHRIGFNSLDLIGEDYDWSHANSISYTPDRQALLVSLRHQDAVVKLSLPDGEVEWILANPDGWPPELEALRLQPVGEPFGWPYHQHAPMYGPGGELWLFDNGNLRGTTPYSPAPDPLASRSRVVAYAIDEVAGTVRQVFEHPGDPDGLFSIGYGNADVQPTTGTVLATYGALAIEDGQFNTRVGRGARTVRLIEVDPATAEVVMDLRLWSPGDLFPHGVVVDRAIRIATLYGPGVSERWLE